MVKVKCLKCGCIVGTPEHKWQMNYCGCGNIAVDISGNSFRIIGDDYEIISKD